MNLRPDVADHPARILIVDDIRHRRQLLEVMLAPEGFQLLSAASGEEAIAMVEQQPPDLILLDIMLPGMDGYQVAGKIKGNLGTKNIPIIVVTALGNRDARMLALSAGAEDFLSEPVDRAELCVRVRNLLRLKAYGEYYNEYSQMLEAKVALRTADLVERTKILEQQAAILSDQAALLDLAQDAIVVHDMHAQILFWSRGAEVMYGWPCSEALGRIMHELLKTEFSEPIEQIEATLLSRGQWNGELTNLKRDGARLTIASRCTLQRSADGVPARVLAINNDISERKGLEMQLRQSQKIEAVGQLAGGIAHDFNNLLGVIVGYSDILLEHLAPNQQLHKDAEQINKTAYRAALLTRQLLAFSRKEVLLPIVLDLNAVLVDTGDLLLRLIGENIELLVVPGKALGRVKADPMQLKQVAMNLAVNARDAMPHGGKLTIETKNVEIDEQFALQHAQALAGRYVMLVVSDTGCGMDAETQAHIFEPFFTTKGPGKGTGLGLATVYGVVKQTGGFILVDSEPGKGAAFNIYLPFSDGVVETERSSEKAKGDCPGSEIILVVEDDADLRVLTHRSLEEIGYTVLEAESPAEAIRVSEEHGGSIHLMVTDVVMPGMSGRELADRLIVPRPEMKVLYVSGYTDDAIFHHGVLAPDLAFLHKPFSRKALARKVREVLNADRAKASEVGSGDHASLVK